MSDIKHGGPVIPTLLVHWNGAAIDNGPGLLLRDFFAALAMQGAVAAGACEGKLYQSVADNAYRISDAMLFEREIKKQHDASFMESLVSALREIAEPYECGCKPCTGACASSDMRELHELHRSIAMKALASIPDAKP